MADPTLDETEQVVPPRISNICHMGGRPQLLTGFFRELLTTGFQNPDQIINQPLKKYTWTPSPESKILIDSVSRWNPEETQKRPALLIKRNEYQNARLGIGDFFGINEQGDERFSTFWTGSHTIFAISHKSAAMAELLAYEALMRLVGFGPYLRSQLDLMKYQVLHWGPASILEEHSENFVSPITVGISYNQEWEVRMEAPRLRRVSLSTLLDLGE